MPNDIGVLSRFHSINDGNNALKEYKVLKNKDGSEIYF